MNGIHHENEAIAILERELIMLEKIHNEWSEEAKKEYSEAYGRIKRHIREINTAINILTAI